MIIPLNYTKFNTGEFTLINNEITINTATTITVNITYKVGINVNNGSFRSTSKTVLEISSGGGAYVEILGSTVYGYHRQFDNGSQSMSSTQILNIGPSDKIRIKTIRESGGDTLKTLANACSIVIMQI